MDSRIAKPPPAGLVNLSMDAWTAPFWEAAARHELNLPRCADCGSYRMPPTPFCPHCRSQNIAWVAFDGAAALYSYTIVERAIIPGSEDSIPYVPAIVEFQGAGGVRLITNIIDCEIGRLEVGIPVDLRWIDLENGSALPAFTIETADNK